MNAREKIALARQLAESDLENFIRLVHPQRVLGGVHSEIIQWWTRTDAKSHQLLLLPRDHMKSALCAYRVAWEITKDPTIRVLYISSTSNLAEKQAKFIRDILTSSIYRRYWPEMVNEEEGKREKWTEREFSVDHPKRRAEAVRDPTLFTAGLTTGIVGLHCDIAVLDDVVVNDNAYTVEGRDRVKTRYSLLSSIESTDAREWVVGTRYHPNDLYNELQLMFVDEFNNEGELVLSEPLFEVFERQVENMGDGTGEFLWPRQQRYDGKWFGFDRGILAKKRAQYLDKTQFRAQYYNDPNDPSSAPINSDHFQYFEREKVTRNQGYWYYGNKRLNVFAAIDFAYTLTKKADFTTIVVVGVDPDRNYYVLDIDRFKTDQISEYFNRVLRLHQKWDFRKLRAETTSAQNAIVKELKNKIREFGLAMSIDESTPNRHQGRKEERVQAILQPKYENLQMWHYRGGNCQTLEEELVLQNPPHDDVKDCLASVLEITIAPSPTIFNRNKSTLQQYIHPRFGGVS